jgi:diguanylate cyclase (GGDEF)-like protein
MRLRQSWEALARLEAEAGLLAESLVTDLGVGSHMERDRATKDMLTAGEDGAVGEWLPAASVPVDQHSVLREVERHLRALHRLDTWLDGASPAGAQRETESPAARGGAPMASGQQISASPVRPQGRLLSQARGLLSRVLADALMWALGHARLLEMTYQMAITDCLTGLFNRRHFDQCLAEESLRAARYGHAISLIMLDIDHFKLCNDRYGHPVGDRILVQVANVLRQSVRRTDILSRYGGDEFAILLPETDGEGARVVAGKVRRAVQDAVLLTTSCRLAWSRDTYRGQVSAVSESSGHQLTISAGIATCRVGGSSWAELLVSADRALYQAKSAGRNCVWGPGALACDSVCALHQPAGGST